jgi:tellurite methyltransferase
MCDIQQRWDQRWLEKASQPDQQADPWLQRITPLLVPGRVLDVACGMGRNAVYLAERGFSVTAVDVSPVALDLLKAQADKRELDIETRLIDLESQPLLPAGPFDLLLNLFYLHRPLLPALLKRVAAGGMAVFRTFSSAGPAQFGSVNPEFALRPGELLEIFAGWDVLLHEEGLEPSRKGGSLAGIVARRHG